MPGPDLPPPTERFTFEAYWHRWPSGAEKCELLDGSLLFSGEFDERDAVTARAAFPGRVVEVDGAGLWVRPHQSGHGGTPSPASGAGTGPSQQPSDHTDG